MPIQFINRKSGLNVEVMRRPIRPQNIVRRPKIIQKDAKGNRIRTMYRPKVFMGVDDENGSLTYAYPKLVCPKCQDAVVLDKDSCPMCEGTGTIDFFSGYEKVATVNGQEMSDDTEIHHWALKEDGTEEEFPQFEADGELIVQMEIPKVKLNDFYIESWGELEGTWKTRTKQGKRYKVQDQHAVNRLYEEAERYVVEGIMGAGRFVKARGHKEWYFVCFPAIMDDGTFGWLVGYWQAKIEMKHLMPVPKTVAIAEEQKTPAKSYLPELQAIVG